MAGTACLGGSSGGDLSPLSSSGSSGSPGDFSEIAFPSQIPRPCPVWGVNQRLLRESQGRAHCTFCTAITKMTRKQSPGLQHGERLDTFQSKLSLPRHVRATSASHVSITAVLIRRDCSHRRGSSALRVPERSRKGTGSVVRKPSWGSRATTDSPSGLCFLPSHISFSLLERALQGG